MFAVTKHSLRPNDVYNEINMQNSFNHLQPQNVPKNTDLFLDLPLNHPNSGSRYFTKQPENQECDLENNTDELSLLSRHTDCRNWYKMNLWHQQSSSEQQNDQISAMNRNVIDNCSRICSHNEKEMPRKNGILLKESSKSLSNDAERIASHHRSNGQELVKAQLSHESGTFSRMCSVPRTDAQMNFTHEHKLADIPSCNLCKNLDFQKQESDSSNTCSKFLVSSGPEKMNDQSKYRQNDTLLIPAFDGRQVDKGNDIFQRRFRDSVSSDPEIYAKSPISSGKLGTQFKKLKNEFLALRSTTIVFQQLMNKVFDDIKWIRLMHQQDDFDWTKDYPREIPHRSPEKRKLKFSDEQLPPTFAETSRGKKLAERSERISGEIKNNQNHCNSSTAQKNVDITIDKCHKTDASAPQNFTSPRPYSDNFTPHLKMMKEENTTISPSLSYHFDHSGKILQFNGKKSNGFTRLQPSPTINKVNPKHHVSVCSIDSGYQDASVLSPLDKIHRMFPSRIHTEPFSVAEKEVETLQLSNDLNTVPKPFINQSSNTTIPNVYVFHNSSKTSSLSQKMNESAVPSKLEKLNGSQNDANHLFENETKSVLAVKAFDNVSEDTYNSQHLRAFALLNNANDPQAPKWIEQNEIFTVLPGPTRPVPKQRKQFLPPLNQKLKKVPSVVDKTNHAQPFVYKDEIIRSPNDGASKKTENFPLNDKHVRASYHEQVNRHSPLPAQLLYSHDTFVETYSNPVSDVRNQDLNFKKKSFHSSRDQEMPPVSKVEPRNGQDVGRRSLEKKCTGQKALEEKIDLSVIRRRSMRLMQELRVLDFENFNIDASKNETEVNESTISEKKSVSESKNSSTSFSSLTGYEVSPPFAKACENTWDLMSPVKLTDKTNGGSNRNTDSSLILNPNLGLQNVTLPPNISISPLRENDLISSLSVESSIPTPIETNIDPDLTSPCASPAKFAVFVPSLIRPKPSLGGTIKSPPGTRKNTHNSLKLRHNSCKSAFRPVAASNVANSSLDRNFDVNQIPARNNTDSSTIKRHTSLPSTSISNKQRYLNMIEAAASANGFSYYKKDFYDGFSKSSYPVSSYPNEEFVDSVISTETAKVSSYNFGDSQRLEGSEKKEKTHFSSEQPSKKDLGRGSTRHTQPLSDKNRSFGSFYSTKNMNEENSNLYVMDNHSTLMMPTSHRHETNGFLPSTSSWKNSEKLTKEQVRSSASMNRPDRKRTKTTSPHNYETVGLSSNNEKKSHQLVRCLEVESTNHHNHAASRVPRRSTVAFLKASLFGKRGKSSKHSQKDGEQLPTPASPEARSSSEKLKTKKRKSKKSKTEGKAKKRSLLRRLSSKERSKPPRVSENPGRDIKDTVVLPDSSGVGYGCPDSEVMERFLAATVAFHANPPKSPLQRLRSSLRSTRHKRKHLMENRVKDDMDIRGLNSQLREEPMKLSKVHNGQECTYV